MLLAAANLATLARTGVEYDNRGDVIDAHAPEMPTRFAKELTQIVRGSVAIGMDRHDGLRLAIRCARDSMPPLRLAIIDDLAKHAGSTAQDVRRRLGKPRTTVDRQMQALHMLDVLDVTEEEAEYGGRRVTLWHYFLSKDIDPTALDPNSLPEKSVPTPRPQEERGRKDSSSYLVSDKSGKDSASMDDLHAATSSPAGESATSATEATGPPFYTCRLCPAGLWHHESQQRGICASCWKHVGNPNQERTA